MWTGLNPKFILRGDVRACNNLIGLALQQLEVLQNLMSFNKVLVDRRILNRADGSVISIYVNQSYNEITITCPPYGGEVIKEKKRRPWEPWEGTKDAVCLDHLWEVYMRTDLYFYPLQFHSSITDYTGANPQPGSGYPGIDPLTNPDMCSWTWTWPVNDDEVDNMFWVDILGGYLECNIHTEVAYRISPSNYAYYSSFGVIWDNRTTGGAPGDPVNPYTNSGATTLEIAAKCWADADPGWGFGETAITQTSSCAFIATDANGHYWVWFLGIDENLYNNSGYNPPGSNTSFIGDLGFSVGSSGTPIQIDLTSPSYPFDSDIVRCGFVFDLFEVFPKGSPGRNTMLECDYIDFY